MKWHVLFVKIDKESMISTKISIFCFHLICPCKTYHLSFIPLNGHHSEDICTLCLSNFWMLFIVPFTTLNKLPTFGYIFLVDRIYKSKNVILQVFSLRNMFISKLSQVRLCMVKEFKIGMPHSSSSFCVCFFS